jgi:hypothetical protein
MKENQEESKMYDMLYCSTSSTIILYSHSSVPRYQLLHSMNLQNVMQYIIILAPVANYYSC